MAFFRRHRYAFQALLSVLFVLLLVWRVDLREAFARLRDVDYRWAVLGVFVFTFSKFVHSYRWRVFLWRRRDLPVSQLFGIFLMHNLVNALVPLRAGDVLRVQVASQRFGIPRAELTATVFVVETLLDGVVFVALVFVGLFFLDLPFFSKPLFATLATLVTLGFLAALALSRMDVGRDYSAVRPVRWLPQPARRSVGELIPRFLEGMESLRRPRLALEAVGISFAAWLVEVVVYWFLGHAFDLGLSFSDYVLVMIGANVVVSLPLTPWDIGPYEVAVAEVLALLGVDRDVAGSYAVGSHLLLLVWISLTGIAAMWALGLRPRDIFGGLAEREAGPSEEPAAERRPSEG
jgi:uncharacterized protein (TIRG00374 family)